MKLIKLNEDNYLKIYIQNKLNLSQNTVIKTRKKNSTYDRALWLAQELCDTTNVNRYLKLVKTQELNVLTSALSFVRDYPLQNENSKNPRVKLFFWYLKGKIKYGNKEKPESNKINLFS